ncbi:uncharacterized protein LOC121706953 [Alosa sapidissima]|uniref:uncharacterized protein LOC121706953 n=1 Tax=Alosa sapidissima TaxID=34773 RepID=UPI001C09A2F9|nr:uncharacterized protein LOC121706953 [Alosa sapidissima]
MRHERLVLGQSGTVAQQHNKPVGFSHDNSKLQATICHETSQVPRSISFSGQRGFSSCFKRDRISSKQTSNQSCTGGGEQAGFLLPVLRHSKERELGSPAHLGPPCVKQAPTKIHVQDAITQSVMSINPPPRLVCDDRRGGRVLSYRCVPCTQKISEARLRGQSLRVPNYPIWVSISAPLFQQMYGSCASPVKEQGHQNSLVFRRFSALRPLERPSPHRFQNSVRSPEELRSQYQLEKESIRALTMHRLPGATHRLPILSNQTLGREDRVLHPVFAPLQTTADGLIQTVPEFARPHGVCNLSSEMGTCNDEGLSTMGLVSPLMLAPAPQMFGESASGVHDSPPLLEKSLSFEDGGSSGGRVHENDVNDRRLSTRLGCNTGGQSCEWRLVPPAEKGTHKLFRTP